MLIPKERAEQADLRFLPTFAEWAAFLPTQREQIAAEIHAAELEARRDEADWWYTRYPDFEGGRRRLIDYDRQLAELRGQIPTKEEK
jgi:hypothetical protein